MKNITRVIQLVLLIGLFFPVRAFADTVILKTGQKIEGRIVEKNNTYLRINEDSVINGEPTRFNIDDIDAINGKIIHVISEQKNRGFLDGIFQRMKDKPYVVVVAVLLPVLAPIFNLSIANFLILSVAYLLFNLFFSGAGFIGEIILGAVATYFIIHRES